MRLVVVVVVIVFLRRLLSSCWRLPAMAVLEVSACFFSILSQRRRQGADLNTMSLAWI